MNKAIPSHIILGDTSSGNEIAARLESLGLPVVHVSDMAALFALTASAVDEVVRPGRTG